MSDNSFLINIAGKTVACEALFATTKEYCTNYLTQAPADFSITITPGDISHERKQSQREYALEGLPDPNFSQQLLEITALQRKIAEQLFAYNTLVFHGSCVAVDGEGYLFTAKSGTGKSTHTRLWREVFGERAVMVNDDKPFLKIGQTAVTVYGSPWMGKHRLGSNVCVPLKAICILERGEENQIAAISPQEAVAMLFQQSNRPLNPRLMIKYMELIDRLSQNLSLYRMECNMDPEAAAVAFRTMSQQI